MGNFTTNLTEIYMHGRAKFDGGGVNKQVSKWIVDRQMYWSSIATE